ncbi:conserved hypothetical protein [Neospora caninum Liverpool]|uniref:Uncharacterized protein n=1 Tax=Neospora caninum (strain Liverpool) TaxID=572307 RepID=F0VLI6_NEOCL|nr:conserved hypothetical protein [Neospora caninum Liverpool]CBZ54114.1 conserved hypothetical protein [Neospora caninum Liverpool]|eukprot:XP_003884145.1 conserved hypothetical protein [Neospora caninum Liverpool]
MHPFEDFTFLLSVPAPTASGRGLLSDSSDSAENDAPRQRRARRAVARSNAASASTENCSASGSRLPGRAEGPSRLAPQETPASARCRSETAPVRRRWREPQRQATRGPVGELPSSFTHFQGRDKDDVSKKRVSRRREATAAAVAAEKRALELYRQRRKQAEERAAALKAKAEEEAEREERERVREGERQAAIAAQRRRLEAEQLRELEAHLEREKRLRQAQQEVRQASRAVAALRRLEEAREAERQAAEDKQRRRDLVRQMERDRTQACVRAAERQRLQEERLLSACEQGRREHGGRLEGDGREERVSGGHEVQTETASRWKDGKARVPAAAVAATPLCRRDEKSEEKTRGNFLSSSTLRRLQTRERDFASSFLHRQGVGLHVPPRRDVELGRRYTRYDAHSLRGIAPRQYGGSSMPEPDGTQRRSPPAAHFGSVAWSRVGTEPDGCWRFKRRPSEADSACEEAPRQDEERQRVLFETRSCQQPAPRSAYAFVPEGEERENFWTRSGEAHFDSEPGEASEELAQRGASPRAFAWCAESLLSVSLFSSPARTARSSPEPSTRCARVEASPEEKEAFAPSPEEGAVPRWGEQARGFYAEEDAPSVGSPCRDSGCFAGSWDKENCHENLDERRAFERKRVETHAQAAGISSQPPCRCGKLPREFSFARLPPSPCFCSCASPSPCPPQCPSRAALPCQGDRSSATAAVAATRQGRDTETRVSSCAPRSGGLLPARSEDASRHPDASRGAFSHSESSEDRTDSDKRDGPAEQSDAEKRLIVASRSPGPFATRSPLSPASAALRETPSFGRGGKGRKTLFSHTKESEQSDEEVSGLRLRNRGNEREARLSPSSRSTDAFPYSQTPRRSCPHASLCREVPSAFSNLPSLLLGLCSREENQERREERHSVKNAEGEREPGDESARHHARRATARGKKIFDFAAEVYLQQCEEEGARRERDQHLFDEGGSEGDGSEEVWFSRNENRAFIREARQVGVARTSSASASEESLGRGEAAKEARKEGWSSQPTPSSSRATYATEAPFLLSPWEGVSAPLSFEETKRRSLATSADQSRCLSSQEGAAGRKATAPLLSERSSGPHAASAEPPASPVSPSPLLPSSAVSSLPSYSRPPSHSHPSVIVSARFSSRQTQGFPVFAEGASARVARVEENCEALPGREEAFSVADSPGASPAPQHGVQGRANGQRDAQDEDKTGKETESENPAQPSGCRDSNPQARRRSRVALPPSLLSSSLLLSSLLSSSLSSSVLSSSLHSSSSAGSSNAVWSPVRSRAMCGDTCGAFEGPDARESEERQEAERQETGAETERRHRPDGGAFRRSSGAASPSSSVSLASSSCAETTCRSGGCTRALGDLRKKRSLLVRTSEAGPCGRFLSGKRQFSGEKGTGDSREGLRQREASAQRRVPRHRSTSTSAGNAREGREVEGKRKKREEGKSLAEKEDDGHQGDEEDGGEEEPEKDEAAMPKRDRQTQKENEALRENASGKGDARIEGNGFDREDEERGKL